MTHADTAVTTLKDAARNAYKATFDAGSHFARSHTDVQQASDIVDVMARMIALVTAIERLHDIADDAVKSLRTALVTQMSETGATTIQGEHHTASLSRKPAFVSIDQDDLIPAEYVVQKPSIDKRAIAAAIKGGALVPGASLLTPNEPVLVLRARKEAVAA